MGGEKVPGLKERYEKESSGVRVGGVVGVCHMYVVSTIIIVSS